MRPESTCQLLFCTESLVCFCQKQGCKVGNIACRSFSRIKKPWLQFFFSDCTRIVWRSFACANKTENYGNLQDAVHLIFAEKGGEGEDNTQQSSFSNLHISARCPRASFAEKNGEKEILPRIIITPAHKATRKFAKAATFLLPEKKVKMQIVPSGAANSLLFPSRQRHLLFPFYLRCSRQIRERKALFWLLLGEGTIFRFPL